MALVQHSDLAARYGRMTKSELLEVVGAPAGTFTDEALALAKSELASRPDVEVEETEEEAEPVVEQSKGRVVGAVLLMLFSSTFLAPAILKLVLLALDPSIRDALIGLAAFGIGALVLLCAYKLDRRFWAHASRAFGIAGVGQAALSAVQIATAESLSVESVENFLRGVVNCLLAIAFWLVGRRS